MIPVSTSGRWLGSDIDMAWLPRKSNALSKRLRCGQILCFYHHSLLIELILLCGEFFYLLLHVPE
jgi:hypothetical protein